MKLRALIAIGLSLDFFCSYSPTYQKPSRSRLIFIVDL